MNVQNNLFSIGKTVTVTEKLSSVQTNRKTINWVLKVHVGWSILLAESVK